MDGNGTCDLSLVLETTVIKAMNELCTFLELRRRVAEAGKSFGVTAFANRLDGMIIVGFDGVSVQVEETVDYQSKEPVSTW